MITEHVLLHVADEQSAAFEAAFVEARRLIALSPGFVSLSLCRDAETSGQYLLLVEWESIAAHRDGFRKSERYAAWSALLHPFYESMPVVRYFGRPI